MTMIRETPVQCPDCGRESRATIYSSVNVGLYPSLKEQLLSGELLQWQCEGCGARRLNVYPILYHDMVRGILIQRISPPYAPTLQALAAALPSEADCRSCKSLRSDYRFRVVREFDDLLEKIRILEAGLDDRAIEWEKCLYSKLAAATDDEFVQSGEDGLAVEFVQPRFLGCIEENGKRQMSFSGPVVMRLPGFPSVPSTLTGPDSIYQRALLHLDAHLPWPKSIKGDFLVIDQDYLKLFWSVLPDISEHRD
jgi:hypothetical protein